ncbi:MAG: imidazole glycerol phosphate synthase subunit HisH [Acidimicrobiaceae bacterium]|nr:imidazole glycerol phosphate synthase subunit HisH [Acidimicrobiaceae bacterium]
MIVVADYGIGNLGSAYKALVKIGADARMADSPGGLSDINGLILPGVGSFGACIGALRSSGLDLMVLEAVEAGIPVLGICVGMQMLYEGSEESPDVPGLGLVDGWVRRLSGAPKVPHMSWNQVEYINGGGESLLFKNISDRSWFYFVHSFAPDVTDDTSGICNYGNGFSASVAKGRVLGTQFHPEKSSTTGLALISNFVESCHRKVVD